MNKKSGPPLSTTDGAVSELKLSFSADEISSAALALARQSSLGSLKHLHFSMVEFEVINKSSLGKLRALLHQILNTRGLKYISLNIICEPELPALTSSEEAREVPVPASLRRLEYSKPYLDPYLPLHLKWHAATLEDVSLAPAVPRAAFLLSSMPRLRRLQCTLQEDMEVLLQCPSLETLHLMIYLTDRSRPLLPAVRAFLTEAVTRLENLVLDFWGGDESDEAVDLVLCLEGTEEATTPAALRTLKFLISDGCHAFGPDPTEQLRHLGAVLYALPNLTSLDLGGAPTSDLLVVVLDGEVVPKLVELTMNAPWPCPHDWAHGWQARALMRRYRRLHVHIHPMVHQEDEVCEYCREHKCHKIPEYGRCTLFSHSKGARCDVKHEKCEIAVIVS
ncbi:uncharacterized protein LOC117646616 [Thrips palmi]|uniref:Uncharacterized protein LOC117646616 n=1 Tax=Thrips palmi TaxID=161013 RepID=A0A6P8Z9C0_THRPL|nr:uncharacterized protein LOC117646616 [Thrips palmi]XP_034243580.1 uncharacterized protein LOC117646616 [Thrips palmi]XP_034243587.1 uncharacterized protein LOC117646616 [Thrips palmi]XP_034243597.1 uncharacterized protein LOC117646616 [Thrips palmi]